MRYMHLHYRDRQGYLYSKFSVCYTNYFQAIMIVSCTRTGGSLFLRARLVHCNDYYLEIGISIIRNTINWNVISITIH